MAALNIGETGGLQVYRAAAVLQAGLACQPDPRLLRHRGSAVSGPGEDEPSTVTCGSSYLFEYQAGGGERVGLVLDFFDAPDLVVVNDEMAEFVSAIEPGSCPVVLVGAEHDDGPVVEGEREGVDIGGVQRETDDQDAVLFEGLGDVRYRAVGHAERLPYLPGCFLEFAVGGRQAGDGNPG